MSSSNQTNGIAHNGTDDLGYTTRRTLIERGVRQANNLTNNPNGSLDTSTNISLRAKQHEDEQRELQELNTKLSTYLDHVHNLENFNGQLLAELEDVKKKSGKNSDQFNAAHAPQLKTLRDQIDNTLHDKILQELQLQQYEDDIKHQQQRINAFESDMKKRINELEQELRDANEYLDNLKNQFDHRSDDVARQRSNLEKLDQEYDNLQKELLNQRLERLMLENELQTLREQAAFDNANYEAQREEILSFNVPSINLARFYRNELVRAIDDIRHDFEVLSESQYNDLEEFYRIKTEEIKEKIAKEAEQTKLINNANQVESIEDSLSSYLDLNDELKNLKFENNQLEIDFKDTLDDLQRIRDEHTRENEKLDQEFNQLQEQLDARQTAINGILENNISLKFELITYRNLLNSEEKRLDRMKLGGNFTPSTPNTDNQQVQKLSAKKTITGSVFIDAVDLIEDSVVITAKKSSNKNQSLENWTIHRQNDQQPEIVFQIPSFILQPEQTIRILSKSSPESARYESNIIFAEQIETWGQGQVMTTRLIDNNNQEKTNLVQTLVSE